MNSESPKGWLLSSLGDVCRFTMGQSPSSETYNGDGEGLPFFQGKADFGSRHPKIRSWCTKPVKVANENAILFSVRAPVGEVNVTPFKACVGRGLAAIEAESADQEFIYQKLQHLKPDFALLSQGSTFEAVNGDQLRQFPIALPPRQEQQKIATILSSVDDVIEKTRTQIDKLKDLKTGMMQELLTQGIGHTEFKDSPVGRIPASWSVVSLQEICSLSRGRFSHRPRNDPAFYEGPYPFLQTGDIPKESIWITQYSQSLNERGLSVSKSFPEGTLVITIAATIGEVGFLSFDACFPDSLVGISVNPEKASSVFILYILRYFKAALQGLAPQTAQKNINLEALNPFEIPLPPINEQHLIAGAIYSIDSKLEKKQEKLIQLNGCKRALMQDLLTGKVRVNTDQQESEVA